MSHGGGANVRTSAFSNVAGRSCGRRAGFGELGLVPIGAHHARRDTGFEHEDAHLPATATDIDDLAERVGSADVDELLGDGITAELATRVHARGYGLVAFRHTPYEVRIHPKVTT